MGSCHLSESKKYAKKHGAEIFRLNEAGIKADNPAQRTWAEEGKTPVVKTSSQNK